MSSLAIADELSCHTPDIADAILNQQSIVPKKIYHSGKKSILEKDIMARTVPQEDWDKYIMSGEAQWEQKATRRGFYGTAGFETNSFTSEAFIEISIKNECRRPERVVSLTNLNLDNRFINWFHSFRSQMSFDEFSRICTMDFENYEGFDDPRCEKIVDEFLKSQKIAIVLDHAVQKSFYIRDRNCIETIRGTAEEVIDIFAANPGLWIQQCKVPWSLNLVQYNMKYLFFALNEVKTINPKKISQIQENAKVADDYFEEVVDSFLRCQKNKAPGFFEKYFSEFPGGLHNYSEICR